ncbi:LeuA family protein (plasmid) [Haloferacaceae archaeon DSL9]
MKLTDVTLREGNQLPGRSYDAAAKVEAGAALDELGVAYIQAGFPATGSRDRRAISELASTADAAVVGLARSLPADVDAALDAGADVVEIFGPLADRQLDRVLQKTRDEMFELFRAAIDRAHDGGAVVHLSLLDAFRTDPEPLVRTFERFDDVEYVNLADTVGVRTPRAVERRLTRLSTTVDLERAGVHFHDDLGVATANALVARRLGVGKIDVSVAGLGERAGNVPLEEFVATTAIDGDESLGVATDRLIPACEAVLGALGEDVSERKAVLGRDATRHESGIHTAAMLDDPSLFEPFDPATFGGERELVFGEGTGRGGARRLLARAGVAADDDTVAAFLELLAARGPLSTSGAVALAGEAFGE